MGAAVRYLTDVELAATLTRLEEQLRAMRDALATHAVEESQSMIGLSTRIERLEEVVQRLNAAANRVRGGWVAISIAASAAAALAGFVAWVADKIHWGPWR
jgi:cob(I)alamin adenosyltransferase